MASKREDIDASMNSVADHGKTVSKNMSLTCSISNAFSSVVDAVSNIDLPDISLPDFGGDKSMFGDMGKKAESAVSDLSEAMSGAYKSMKKYMGEFDDYIEDLCSKIADKLDSGDSGDSELKAKIILAFGSVSAFLSEIKDEASSHVHDAVTSVEGFCSTAADKVSGVVSDMGKSIASAFEGSSMSDCDGLSEASKNVPPDMQTPGIANSIANADKSKPEALISSLKAGPATSSVDDIHNGKADLVNGMKFNGPSNDDLKSKIAQKYPEYFGEGKLNLDEFA